MSKSYWTKRYECRLMTAQYQAEHGTNCFILDEPIMAKDCVNGVMTEIRRIYLPKKRSSFDYPSLKYRGAYAKNEIYFRGVGQVAYLPVEALESIYKQLRKYVKRIKPTKR